MSASGPERARFDAPDVYALAVAQQQELTGLDGRGDIGPARNAAMFEPPDGVFLAVRDGGRPVACGRGLGRLLLEALEEEARRLGYTGIVLETGKGQAEAAGLYTSSGYEPIPCYEPYVGQAISRCYEKHLL